MNTKLTLRMDDNLIESAKEHAAKTGKSVSRIGADLFEIIKRQLQKSQKFPLPFKGEGFR